LIQGNYSLAVQFFSLSAKGSQATVNTLVPILAKNKKINRGQVNIILSPTGNTCHTFYHKVTVLSFIGFPNFKKRKVKQSLSGSDKRKASLPELPIRPTVTCSGSSQNKLPGI